MMCYNIFVIFFAMATSVVLYVCAGHMKNVKARYVSLTMAITLVVLSLFL